VLHRRGRPDEQFEERGGFGGAPGSVSCEDRFQRLGLRHLLAGVEGLSLLRSICSTSSASLNHSRAASSNALFLEGSLVRAARSLSSAPILRYLSARVFHQISANVPNGKGEALVFGRSSARPCCNRSS
jgi:hypothetical protein